MTLRIAVDHGRRRAVCVVVEPCIFLFWVEIFRRGQSFRHGSAPQSGLLYRATYMRFANLSRTK
jgi:hypothetical protein